jgi:AcrR family transcriptional regulator
MLVPRPTKKEIVTEFRTREILGAARRLMQNRGVEAVTMGEVAAAAGVAKGTIYLYFQGKEGLVQALLSQVGENLVRDLEAFLARPGSAAEKLQGLTAFLLTFLEQERALFPVYVRDVIERVHSRQTAWGRRIRELEEKYLAVLSRFFAEGIEAGQFTRANPRLLSYLLRGLVRAVGYYQMTEGRKDAVGEALPVLLTLLSSGLLARSAGEVTGL